MTRIEKVIKKAFSGISENPSSGEIAARCVHELAIINYSRTRWIMLITLFTGTAMSVFCVIMNLPRVYLALYFSFALVSLAGFVLGLKFDKSGKVDEFNKHLIFFFACALVWSAAIGVANTVLRGGGITAYMVMIFLPSAVIIVRTEIAVTAQTLIMSAFTAALLLFQASPAGVPGLFVNALICVIISVALARMSYNSAIDNIVNKIVIESKNQELTAAKTKAEFAAQSATSLLEEINRQNQTLMELKDRADAASRSKSAFLATMSHEIRTPLNAIIGLSEIELQKKLPRDIQSDLEKIYNSGSSLLSIINDILDVSKIEAGSFELAAADYDVPGMVNDTIHMNLVRIGSKRIVFALEIDPAIPVKLFGDELRIKQVLNNLLSNAIKYTQEGKVTLKILWERRGDDAWLSFTVSDTGRGIRQEDTARLFSEYAQFDVTANRHIEGTGLGLSITKNLVKLMGGTIGVESEYGKGSAFTVRLPQRIVDETPIGAETAENLRLFRFADSRSSRNINLIRTYMPYGRVLVVDDVETNLDVAKGLLLPYGLSVDCASGGQEAIDKIRAAGQDGGSRYDLVLMDHMMPVMDGVEAVRIIRNELDGEYAKTVPVVALTANALAGNEGMFLSHGFNAFISKPIDIMQLDLALNTWIKGRQDRETLLRAEMDKNALRAELRAEPGILDGVTITGLDLPRGRERYTNDAAYLEVLRSYHKHTPPLLEKLRLFQQGGFPPESLAEYTITVHGLKGSSYGICANAAGKAAEELENAARAGDIERIRAGNMPFIETAEQLLRELGTLLEKAAAGKKAKRAADVPDRELLDKLLEAAKRYKTPAMEAILAELESCEYETGGELVTWLREQADNLEYDAIRERLENGDNYTNGVP